MPHQVGQVLTGVVQGLKPYGAFVDLGFTRGLLHVSDVSHERMASMDEVLKVGDKVKVGGVVRCTCARLGGRT